MSGPGLRSRDVMLSSAELRATGSTAVSGGSEVPAEPEALLERARRGDRAAWDALVARHGRRVLLVLLARGVRASRAEEIAQEAWSRLALKATRGELARVEMPGLAIAQALHLATDDARAEKTRRAESLEASEEALALRDPAPGPLDRLVSREALGRALAELDRCPPRARDVFTAVYDAPDVPHAEIASKVGLSVQRLRQTLCEVRARLRAALEEKED